MCTALIGSPAIRFWKAWSLAPARDARCEWTKVPAVSRRIDRAAASAGGTAPRLSADPVELSRLMWQDVGLFRDRDGLTRALSVLEPAWQELDAQAPGRPALDPQDWRTSSILTVGRLIARAALRREESRGGHYRADFPDRDDVHWKHRVGETRECVLRVLRGPIRRSDSDRISGFSLCKGR